jgi:hypothetical protein
LASFFAAAVRASAFGNQNSDFAVSVVGSAPESIVFWAFLLVPVG